MFPIAPNYIHIPVSSTLQRVGDAPSTGQNSSILVYGFTISANGIGEVIFFEEDESTVITRCRMGANSITMFTSDGGFLAKNGLKVTTPSNASCTVYYGPTGY